MDPIFQSWLAESAVIFLILGGIAATLIGLILVFVPQHFPRISGVLDRWISTRRFDRLLERWITLDPWLYRHRRITGALILGGALFVLYYFGIQIDRAEAVAALAQRLAWPMALAGAMLDAMVLIALLGALGAVFVALCLLFRPSLLRQFEQSANRWFSLRRAMKSWEMPRDDFEELLARHVRQVGLFLLLGGSYLLVMLAAWWIHL